MKRLLKVVFFSLTLIHFGFESMSQKSNYPDFGFHFSKNKRTVTVPFQLMSNLIVVPITINNSDTLKFIFDTGVSNTIITDPALAVKLNLKKTRKVKIAGAGEGNDQMAYVSPNNTFRMGEIIAKNQNLIVLENDFLEISQILGMKIHGIFGYDIFNYFVVNIDFASSNIFLQKPEKFKYKASKGVLFPIEIQETKPYLNDVSIEINNKTMLARLMIDTGAGHAISLELTKKDEVELPKNLVRSQLGKGLNGIINGSLGRTDKINLGKFELKDVITSFPDSESVAKKLSKEIIRNGNIGCDILRRFSVTFNYRDKYMLLKPYNSRLKEPFEHNMSGIEFIAKGASFNEFYIDRVDENSPGYLAGFREGDQVISINNSNYSDETLSNIYKTLQKKEGRSISLVVKRGSEFIFNTFVLKKII
ncbi:MAG: aspartyl protease family protein [Bacteroidota bacterium]